MTDPSVSGDRINNSVMLFLDPSSARYVANAMVDAIAHDSTVRGSTLARQIACQIACRLRDELEDAIES